MLCSDVHCSRLKIGDFIRQVNIIPFFVNLISESGCYLEGIKKRGFYLDDIVSRLFPEPNDDVEYGGGDAVGDCGGSGGADHDILVLVVVLLVLVVMLLLVLLVMLLVLVVMLLLVLVVMLLLVLVVMLLLVLVVMLLLVLVVMLLVFVMMLL